MERLEMHGDREQRSEAGAPTVTRTAATHSGAAPAGTHPEILIGQTIGRYQVRRILGEGGMGRVYLARDVVLGRSVALKFVRDAVSSERFLQEAVAVARLNHPNIVQLYDFAEYEGGIYLALEYIEGETLGGRIRSGQVEHDEALRYARAIADALVHAHAAGVIHCDLKPSNVMVGRDGRVRVVDFGIAWTLGTSDVGGGTPGWMAPEQWSRGPVTDRADVWALATVTAELLTGTHPLKLAAAPRSGVPGLVADLIARSLVPVPDQRPSAADWASALDDLINGRRDAHSEDAPYPGLAAFHERDARFYFGREREIDEFLEHLRDAPHLPLVGPSGSGKSSFLYAGVIPRLRARERWTVIALRPGSDPVGALARCLVAATIGLEADGATPHAQAKAEVAALRDALVETPGLLAVRLATLAEARGSRVLLAVDQLEEVFTQCESDMERGRFLAMVLRAADDPADPVRVVYTLRDDCLGKIGGLWDRSLGTLAGLRTVFALPKLRDDDLRRTITGPLARRGYEFDDPQIVEDLITEVGSAAIADLPLLQFACRTLWDGRDVASRQLRRVTYQEMGGLAGALARHAERALTQLTPDELRTARQILLRLVSGTTRCSVPRDQLVASSGHQGIAESILDRLRQARLLVEYRSGDGADLLVEIAHESLLQTWSQLARWVDEIRDERRLLVELDEVTSLWERRGRRAEETWAPDEIAAVQRRAAQLGLALPARTRAFLAAGDARHRALLRRRRVRVGTALAFIASVTVIAISLFARYLDREHLIRTNAGTVDLVFTAFDWQHGRTSAVPIDELDGLSWMLHAPAPDDPHSPGTALRADELELLASSHEPGRRVDRVRARGGAAFLRITGRGRSGQACAPSWVRIQTFPGYGGGAAPLRLEIAIPTCQASRADMLRVDEGAFVYGGPGEPPSRFHGESDYTELERERSLATFWMDRTEVSNAAFAPFGAVAKITGYPAPVYANDQIHARDGDGDHPVTSIDAYGAEAFCRYMGKQLPGDLEWVKAARGGAIVHGRSNPHPRRQYPWGPTFAAGCVNQQGDSDGEPWTTSVESFGCGAGPYGQLNLLGNVDEWISRAKQIDHDLTPLHAIRGGSAISPPALDHATISFRNHRTPDRTDYALGFRCVAY